MAAVPGGISRSKLQNVLVIDTLILASCALSTCHRAYGPVLTRRELPGDLLAFLCIWVCQRWIFRIDIDTEDDEPSSRHVVIEKQIVADQAAEAHGCSRERVYPACLIPYIRVRGVHTLGTSGISIFLQTSLMATEYISFGMPSVISTQNFLFCLFFLGFPYLEIWS